MVNIGVTLRLIITAVAIQALTMSVGAQEAEISELMNLQLSLPQPINLQYRGTFQVLYNADLSWQTANPSCSIAVVFNYERPKFGEEKLNGKRDATLLGDIYQFSFSQIRPDQYVRPQEGCLTLTCEEKLFRVPIIVNQGKENDSELGYVINQNGQELTVLVQDAPEEILQSAPILHAPMLIGARDSNANMSFRFRENDLQRGLDLLKNITKKCATDEKTEAASSSDPLDQVEIDELVQRIQQCWEIPSGAREGKVRVKVRVQLNRDGSIRGKPKILNGSKKPVAIRTSQSVVDALLQCQNYDFLPTDKYLSWQELTLTFDPSKY